jgi:hypothetical protein
MKRIVVFTGAGVSAESGLGTSRDADGLCKKYRIEDVCTHEAWLRNPQLCVEFYNARRRDRTLRYGLSIPGMPEFGAYRDRITHIQKPATQGVPALVDQLIAELK